MLDTNPKTKPSPSPLAQWVQTAIGQPGMRLKVRLRSDQLYIICESQILPDPAAITEKLQASFPEISTLGETVNISHIHLYGLTPGQDYPQWSEVITPQLSSKQLSSHQISPDPRRRLDRPVAPAVTSHDRPTPNILEESLGELSKLPRELTKASSRLQQITNVLLPLVKPFGITIKVEEIKIKANPDINALSVPLFKLGKQSPAPAESNPSPQRLLVNCYCEYPLAPERIIFLLLQHLRRLNLDNYRDVLLSGYLEEKNKPLWAVKGNLNPNQQLLAARAKWGDEAALVELLNQTFIKEGFIFRSVHKEATLHLFCSNLPTTPPEQSFLMTKATPILQELAPQGVQSVAVYGIIQQEELAETPVWIQWLNVAPAHPELTTQELARQGGEEAIAFLLQQAVNPDLKLYLATGGIDILLKQRGDLLDIIAEAPLCPSQGEVVKPIVRCLLALNLPGIAGVRIYGRPAGKSQPDWKYGKDFRPRQSSSPFSKKITSKTSSPSPVVAPENPGEGKSLAKISPTYVWFQPLKGILVRSGIFIDQSSPETAELDPKIALVWGILGLLLLAQTDWLLGVMSSRQQLARTPVKSVPTQVSISNLASSPPSPPQSQSNPPEAQVFNSSGFTGSGNSMVVIDQQNQQVKSARIAQATSTLLAVEEHSNPSFNSSLLNEKLLLYQERVKQNGRPPDVLIVGSSRALRGIDPLVLKEALAKQGYKQVDIFNFGINGATVKFVDFLLRRMLTPEQLPKLIIWADGARAFNSGREDITYDALTKTDGYRQVVAGTFPGSPQAPAQSSNQISLGKFSYTEGNDRLIQILGNFSQSYTHHQYLQQLAQQHLAQVLPSGNSRLPSPPQNLEPKVNESAIDIDGFLPLGERFDPNSYYQQYAKVPGDYDKDYEAFHLDGRQDTALGELMYYLQGRGVTTVFVNLPLTDHYLDKVRTNYEQQFEQYLRERSEQQKFIVRNLNVSWLQQYQYFSDPSHLNRYGAEALARQLAQDPVIPWTSR